SPFQPHRTWRPESPPESGDVCGPRRWDVQVIPEPGKTRLPRSGVEEDQMTEAVPDVGPIDYLAVHFPGAKLTGEALGELISLADRGIIRILDLRAAVFRDNGEFAAVALTDLDGDGELDLAVFSGVESGLIDDD